MWNVPGRRRAAERKQGRDRTDDAQAIGAGSCTTYGSTAAETGRAPCRSLARCVAWEASALRGSAKTAALTPAGWASWGGDAGDGGASLWVADSEDEEFRGAADASFGEEPDADASLLALCDALRCVAGAASLARIADPPQRQPWRAARKQHRSGFVGGYVSRRADRQRGMAGGLSSAALRARRGPAKQRACA